MSSAALLIATIVLRGATVLDMTGAPPHRADVVLDGERIAAVVPPGQGKGDRTVDLTGKFLLPGFADLHAHVLLHPIDPSGRPAAKADRGLSRLLLKLLLTHGVTTARDPGAEKEAAVALRAALAAGTVPGPRLWTCGRILDAGGIESEPFVRIQTARAAPRSGRSHPHRHEHEVVRRLRSLAEKSRPRARAGKRGEGIPRRSLHAPLDGGAVRPRARGVAEAPCLGADALPGWRAAHHRDGHADALDRPWREPPRRNAVPRRGGDPARGRAAHRHAKRRSGAAPRDGTGHHRTWKDRRPGGARQGPARRPPQYPPDRDGDPARQDVAGEVTDANRALGQPSHREVHPSRRPRGAASRLRDGRRALRGSRGRRVPVRAAARARGLPPATGAL